MSNLFSLRHPLVSIFWPQNIRSYTHKTVLIVLGSLLLTIGSKVSIPLFPVPLTLQTLAIFFIGTTYGSSLALATLAFHISLFALGLPVLAGSKMGLTALYGPTAGYIAGWFFAIGISGLLIERGWGRSIIGSVFAQVIGSVPIYVFGLMVLSHFVGGYEKALTVGFYPFILGDSLKIIFLSFFIPLFWRQKSKKNS
jgi:biotin transport system substrate-specific component